MQTRVLVTGGAGFIGSHTVDLLLRQGFNVAILDSLVEQVHGPVSMERGEVLADGVRREMARRKAVAAATWEPIDSLTGWSANPRVNQSDTSST